MVITRAGWWASGSLLGLAMIAFSACQAVQGGGRTETGLQSEKVGVIDIQAVFERSRSGKQALAGLMAEFGDHRRLLTEEETTLKDLAGQLGRSQAGLAPEERRIQTERYLARLEQYRVQVQAFNQDLARRHRALVNAYLPKISAVARPLAEREGFSTILHQGRPETVMIVFYRAPEIDLTDRVIEALDRQEGL